MASNQSLLFFIVGKNEPLYEAEIHKRSGGKSDASVARQSYFVVHSSLDLVDKATWTSQNVRKNGVLNGTDTQSISFCYVARPPLLDWLILILNQF